MTDAIDLCAGAGGLSLGAERNDISTVGVEIKDDACETYRNNVGRCINRDIRDVDIDKNEYRLVFGGFPCQPFSSANNHKGFGDKNTLADVCVDIVDSVNPNVVLFENVPALKRRHEEYYDHVIGRLKELGYDVDAEILRASNYGVPQSRDRLFIVGHDGSFEWPDENDQTIGTGDVLDTVPERHEHKGGGRTSSCVWRDETQPSHTITAQANNVVRYEGCDFRSWTVEEMKRIQTFPDWFTFVGNKTSKSRQIGNAVPPKLSEKIFAEIEKLL